MSQFCSKCGKKFEQLEAFCPACGQKRITKKIKIRFAGAFQPAYRVFIFQILLFFVYPFAFLKKLNQKLKLRSKSTVWSYHLAHLLLLTIFSGILLRYLLVATQGYPSEDSVGMILSNVLLLAPLFIGGVLFIFCYLISLLRSVRKINQLLSAEYRISWILALMFGVAYVQYKVNKVSGTKTRVTANQININVCSYSFVLLSSLVLFILLSFTPPGKRLLLHSNAISGSYSTDLELSGLDFKGKYYLIKSSPQRTSMNEVAKICENKPDINLSLGCNVQEGNKFNIYISQVNEPVLKGIERYSIVHEMLHTVYAQLTPEEKNKINDALLEQYKIISKTNDTITINAIKPYIGSDPDTFNNELHSILPIYSSDLGKTLEDYYKTIFKDRLKFAKDYRQAEQVLIDSENALKSWEQPLKQAEVNLEKGYSIIEQQKGLLNYYAGIGYIYSYNSLVQTYNSNIDQYNAEYSRYAKIYDGYIKAYDSYSNLYTSLQRNISYQEASVIANRQTEKIQ